jgi:hypothetical protein
MESIQFLSKDIVPALSLGKSTSVRYRVGKNPGFYIKPMALYKTHGFWGFGEKPRVFYFFSFFLVGTWIFEMIFLLEFKIQCQAYYVIG